MKATPKTDFAIKLASSLKVNLPKPPIYAHMDWALFENDINRAETTLNDLLFPSIVIGLQDYVTPEDLINEFWENVDLGQIEACKRLFLAKWKGCLFLYDEAQTSYKNLMENEFFAKVEKEGIAGRRDIEEMAMRYHHVCSRTNIVMFIIRDIYERFGDKEQTKGIGDKKEPKIVAPQAIKIFKGNYPKGVDANRLLQILKDKGLVENIAFSTFVDMYQQADFRGIATSKVTAKRLVRYFSNFIVVDERDSYKEHGAMLLGCKVKALSQGNGEKIDRILAEFNITPT